MPPERPETFCIQPGISPPPAAATSRALRSGAAGFRQREEPGAPEDGLPRSGPIVRSRQLIEESRAIAGRTLRRAEAEAERIRREAADSGRRAADEAALANLLELERLRHQSVERLGVELHAAFVAVLEGFFGELPEHGELSATAFERRLRDALDLFRGEAPIVLTMNPADERLVLHILDASPTKAWHRSVSLQRDPSLPAGTAILSSGGVRIQAAPGMLATRIVERLKESSPLRDAIRENLFALMPPFAEVER